VKSSWNKEKKQKMKQKKEIAVLAGGCFWCTEAVFQRLEGVVEVRSGFSGGHVKNPAYREVTTERTGHAEVIEITFDAKIISFQQLLEVFFATHDPTTLNKQGADKGTHYRSAIFYTSEAQKEIAEQFIKQLLEAKVFENPIVTEVTKFEAFYSAEEYHNDYFNQNKKQGYCQFVIQPKIDKLNMYFRKKMKKDFLE